MLNSILLLSYGLLLLCWVICDTAKKYNEEKKEKENKDFLDKKLLSPKMI